MKLLNPDSESLHKPLPTFDDSQLKDYGYKTRQELVDDMFKFMAKAGGIGLTANQVGINLNMFVLGGHPSIEDGLKLACFNPSRDRKFGGSLLNSPESSTLILMFSSSSRPSAPPY